MAPQHNTEPDFNDTALTLSLETARDISEFLTAVAAPKAQDAHAEKAYAWAVQLDGNNFEAWNGLGRVALARKKDREALSFFERSIEIKVSPAAYVNAAEACRRLGDISRALSYCCYATREDPKFLHAYIELTAILQQAGIEWRALLAIAAGLSVDPANDMLLYARACIELARGDYEQGWKDYEHRPPRLDIVRKIAGAVPEWQRERLTGKTLLVVGEQGIGDQIMFARFLYELEGCEATITALFTRPELARLFEQTGYLIVTSDRELAALKPDYWIAIGSLPYRLEPVATCDGSDYLEFHDAGGRFRALLAGESRLKVGLCWAGNPEHARDNERSLAFEQLTPILDVPGVAFYSFQHGPAKLQAGASCVFDLDAYCHDMADTAAAMGCMDLIISVDTAALHLAGALGIPAWGLIYEPCDWRWDARGTIPWYESVRIFRQPERGNWGAVLAKVADELADLVETQDEVDDGQSFRAPTLDCSMIRAGTLDCSQIRTSWLGSAHETTKPCRYGHMTFYPNDTYIGRALDLYSEYSESEASLLRDLLKPGDTVIEAGANIGGLTLPMAQAVSPMGCVMAIEPQPRYYELLERNTRGCMNAVPMQGALGDSDEPLTFRHVPLDKIHAPGWAADGAEFTSTQCRIDNMFVPALDLIKIDVDGAEQLILKGAEKSIAKFRPLVYVENDKPAEYPELIPWLKERGYRIYQHQAPLFNPDNFAGYKVNVFGSIISLMLLCVPSEKTLDESIVSRHQLLELL